MFWRYARLAQNLLNDVGIQVGQTICSKCGPFELIRTALVEREKFSLQCRGKLSGGTRQKRGATVLIKARQYRIDAVQARARHESYVKSVLSQKSVRF